MGLDPDDNDFEHGDHCAGCEGILYGDETPKYAWAHISDISRCPDALGVTPAGSYKMTQIAPCIWQVWYSPGDFLVWDIFPASRFVAQHGPSGGAHFFSLDPFNPCLDSFGNQNEECAPLIYGMDGSVIVTWGPDAPCGGP